MKHRLFSVAFMFALTLFFTSILSVVKLFTEERIEKNQALALQRVILKALNIPVEKRAGAADIIRVFNERVKPFEGPDRMLYAGLEADGRTVTGYAFPVRGAGFWGPVHAMVSVDRSAREVAGIVFYQHSETPGLGGRITEEWFSKQFEGLRVDALEGESKIFHLMPTGARRASNELDAITGATQTSRAVETFLNKELRYVIKELRWMINKR